MRVKVDPNLCAGVGACESTCPEVFEVIDGRSTVKVEVVPADVEEQCREAVEGCPMNAISIEP
jgi:ferredoxin